MAAVRMISNDSYILWNGLDNRSFSSLCSFMRDSLQNSIYNVIYILRLRSDMQTGFVYLFMPWHRHAMG